MILLAIQIQTQCGKTWKLLLESYSLHTQALLETVSIPEGGYEMLNQQTIPLRSILVSQQDTLSFQVEQIRCQVSCKRQ